MRDQIHVSNPTPFARNEHILFGTREPTKCSWLTVPLGSCSVARVEVPADFTGWVDAVADGHRGTFVVHEAYKEAVAQGLVYEVSINGRNQPLQMVSRVVDHPRLRVFRYCARDVDGVAELWVYLFHNQPTARWQMSYFCEHLGAAPAVRTTKLGLSLGGATNCPITVYHRPDPVALLGAEGRVMMDGQGVTFEGVLPFYSPSMSAAETDTQEAQKLAPLYGMTEWETWGLWKQTPAVFTPEQVEAALARKPSPVDFMDPFRHLGMITHYRPGATGEQAEFGQWLHLECIAQSDSRLLAWEHFAAMRHACRPGFYCEPDGNPVLAKNHPKLRTWGEQYHYDQNASPDRLGRDRGPVSGSSENDSDTARRWYVHDWQHSGWLHLAEDVILTGNLLGADLLRRAGEMRIGQWPDEAARALGRTAFSAVLTWAATGDPHYVTDWVAQVWNWYYTIWQEKTAPNALYRPLRVVWNMDGYTGHSWRSWEDGIAVAGLDAVILSGLITGAPLEQMTEVRDALIHAVLFHGFRDDPEHPCAAGQNTGSVMASGMPWPQGVPLHPTDYCDPKQAGGDKQLTGGTNYRHWVMCAARIGRRIGKETGNADLVARADRVEITSGIGATAVGTEQAKYYGAG